MKDMFNCYSLSYSYISKRTAGNNEIPLGKKPSIEDLKSSIENIKNAYKN